MAGEQEGPLCKQLVTDTEPSRSPSAEILSRCVVGSWSDWSPCTKDCRPPPTTLQPFQWITRTVAPIRPGEDDCQDVATFCSRPCPDSVPLCETKACEVSGWTPWSNCSEPVGERTLTCGRGFSIRTRTITAQPEGYAPQPCPETYEIRQCSESGCKIGCKRGLWSAWSPCTSSCGGGVQTRTRDITQEQGEPRCTITDPVTGASSPAPGYHAVEQRTCNQQVCGVDCEYFDWQPVGPCSKDCGTDGVQRFTKFVKVEGTGDGVKCLPPSHPDLNKTEPCNRRECPPEGALQQHLSNEAQRLKEQQQEQQQEQQEQQQGGDAGTGGGNTPQDQPAAPAVVPPATPPAPAPAPGSAAEPKPKVLSSAWFDGLELWLKITLIGAAVLVALLLLWALYIAASSSGKGKVAAKA